MGVTRHSYNVAVTSQTALQIIMGKILEQEIKWQKQEPTDEALT
jgi:hypothetical protein